MTSDMIKATNGTRTSRMEEILKWNFSPLVMDLVNESDLHSGPPNRDTHFKILIVSEKFVGLNRVERQQKIYSLLGQEFQTGLHALSLRALTPEEAKLAEGFESPRCQSKSTGI